MNETMHTPYSTIDQGYGPKKLNKFPGFRPDQVKWIEDKTADLSGQEKEDTQQELYRQLLPRVIAKKWKEERTAVKNEFYQRNLQKPIGERSLGEIQLRQEDLADKIKDYYGLRHDLSTDDTMKGFHSLMEEDGIEEQVLLDYLNGKNEEILYRTGMKKKTLPQEQSRRDKQKDGAFAPLVRATSAVAGGVDGALSGVWDNAKDTYQDIKRIANDHKKSFGDKFAEILLGEIVLDGAVGTFGNAIGGGISGMVKGFTSEKEKERVSKKVQNMVGKIMKNETTQNLVKAYESMTPEEKQELEDMLEHAFNALDLVGLGSLLTQPVKQAVKTGVKTTGNIALKGLQGVDELVEGGVKKVKNIIDERAIKQSVKALDSNQEKALEVAGRIMQGDTQAQKVGFEALRKVDTKGVKTYKDLYNRLDTHGKGLMKQVDEALEKEHQTFNFWDNLIEREVETAGGVKKVVETPISDGIEQLKELYQQVGDQVAFVKMEGLEDKFAQGGLSLKEMNDLAREYAREFGEKAFTKMGEPKTSVSAELYESQRKAMKEFVREKMPDDLIKNLDREYSQISEGKIHIGKMVEKVNTLTQKLKQRNFLEKGAAFAGDMVNKMTGGTLKTFLSKFATSNIGNKINNSLDMEWELPKLLKQLDDLGRKIDAGELNAKNAGNLADSKYNGKNLLDDNRRGNGEENLYSRGGSEKIGGTQETGILQDLNSRRNTESYGRNSQKTLNDRGGVGGEVGGSILTENTDYQKVHANLSRIKANQPDGYKMDVHSVEDYKNFKTFQSADGKSSVTVKPDGDITSLVSEPGLGRGKDLMLKAIKEGGDRLDCYEEYLPGFYHKAGFEPVARVKFNPEYAPADRKGPGQDIIVMMRSDFSPVDEIANKWGSYGKVESKLKNLPIMEYDEALAYRDSLLEARKKGFSPLREGAETKYQLAEPIKSENFKKWFGDWENDPRNASKVVDAEGKPLVVYHGTNSDFTVFDGASFFTDDYWNADGYGGGERIVEAYLDIKYPLVIDANGAKRDELHTQYGSSTREIVANLDKNKYDGVIFENIADSWIDDVEGGESTVYAVLEQNQIKSATDNIGSFDPSNPDIRYQKHGVANPLEKNITAQRATQLENIRNGRSVQELADHYGVDIKIVESITTPEGLKAYGKYGDGVITLAEKIKEGTAPHELFHATFDMVDSGRKGEILEAIMKEKKLTALDAEEFLADNFAEYFRTGRMKGEKVVGNVGRSLSSKLMGMVKEFYQRVKDWITGTSRNKNQVKKLFDEILDGEIDREMLGESLNTKKRAPATRPTEKFNRETMQNAHTRIIHISDEKAKLSKSNLESLVKTDTTPEEFFQGLKEVFGSKTKTAYMDRIIDGETHNLRIADHTATARNFAQSREYTNNTSIVIKIGEKRFKGDKRVDLVEYVYDKKDLDLNKKQGIVKGLKDWLDSGKYTDQGYSKINKSIRASLENGEVKYQRVYHGSPYEFEKFDSSHMGKGEGEQAHGWGHYVAVDKEVGKAYSKGGNLYEVEVPDPVKAKTPTGKNYLEEADFYRNDVLQKFGEKMGDKNLFISSYGGRSGESLYRAVVSIVGNEKKASKFLENLGYDGIHYHGGRDGEVYVIFDDAKLEIKKHTKL